MVSPLSDPKKPSSWTVIGEGCSSDPSLTFNVKEEKEVEGDDEIEDLEKSRTSDRDGEVERGGAEAPEKKRRSSSSIRGEEEKLSLRFSFILRPLYNDSVQFLHCSLRLCSSDSTRGKPMKEKVKNDCEDGKRVPPLVSRSSTHQVQTQSWLCNPPVHLHCNSISDLQIFSCISFPV